MTPFNFAKTHTTISDGTLRIIKHCRKSLLFFQKRGMEEKKQTTVSMW